MAEAAQTRVQMAMKEFIDNIDKSKLRPVQKRMYLCNAECMDDTMGSMEEVGSIFELKIVFKSEKHVDLLVKPKGFYSQTPSKDYLIHSPIPYISHLSLSSGFVLIPL